MHAHGAEDVSDAMGGRLLRIPFLLAGAGAAIAVVAVLSLLLEPGSFMARLLIDLHAGDSLFPYPLTIQNLLWILLGVGIGDVLYRRTGAARERRAIEMQLLPQDEESILVLEDLPAIRQRLAQVVPRRRGFLCRLVDECILFFSANQNPGQTLDMMTAMVDMEAHRMDLRYTLLRYLAWVLPTIGFIGTVVGISAALSHLELAEGATLDMSRIVGDLSVAFNTTILALLFSAVLVLMIQFTQRSEEEALNQTASYCLKNLVNRLYAGSDH
jgi:biopolymer transport protein ExbB/TolQ